MQRHNLYPHKLSDSPKVENAYMYFKMTNVNNHFTVNQTHKNKWSQCVQKGEGQKIMTQLNCSYPYVSLKDVWWTFLENLAKIK